MAIRCPNLPRSIMWHDWDVHHPLGAGSYTFRNSFLSSILRATRIAEDRTVHSKPVVVHAGYQPNNSPHIGTITVFALAFQLARALKNARRGNLEVRVSLDMVDTAPDSNIRDDVVLKGGYQRSLRHTGGYTAFYADYRNLFDQFSELSSISYLETKQAHLMRMTCVPRIVQTLIKSREQLGSELSPDTGKLALRVACPVCGVADKHGIRNGYDDSTGIITFHCPKHGAHKADLSNQEDVSRLEFNTPLRNLVRALAYASDDSAIHLRVTGGDYAGQYQEQLLFRQWPYFAGYDGDASRVQRPPIHIYAPLTVDWAGSKLSKSLYVKENAYAYLRSQGLSYLLSLEQMKMQGKDPKVAWDEVEQWLLEPKKLFRSYSVEYWHMVFTRAEDMTHTNRIAKDLSN